MQGVIDTGSFYETLDSFYKNKQIDRAEPYMLKTLAAAGRQNDTEGIVAVCNELGGLYRAMRRTEDALWAYEQVMNGLDALGMQGTANYASALINLGNVHIVRKEYEKAYEVDKRAMEIVERAGDSYQLASLCNNMSAILREMGQPEGAIRLAERAIDIIRTMPERVIDLATSYTNLGQARAKGFAYDAARADLAHALSLFEGYNGDKDTHYAIAVSALAHVDYAQGRYREAAGGFSRAAALIARDFGENGDYRQAKENEARALRRIQTLR